MLVIEHNMDVIKIADHIIDLGPEGGDGGGQILFEGTPEGLVKCKESYTGHFLKNELKRSWIDFKNDPLPFIAQSTRELFRRLKKLLSTPNAVPACLSAVVTIVCLIMLALQIDRTARRVVMDDDTPEPPDEVVMLDGEPTPRSTSDSKFGKDGPGRVGLNRSTGEGSGPTLKPSRGSGGGGNRDRHPAQVRVVFSSSGDVVQIRAVRTLPFGLTERAIAAARQIKFVPAMKDGRSVSVHMQLEYNFNLY